MALRSYTVHLRPGRSPVAVSEGGAVWAALLGPVWLLAHGLWLAAVLWLAAAIGIFVLGAVFAPAGIGAAVALVLGSGVFARDIQRFTLELGGYRLAGVVVAADAEAGLVRLLEQDPAIAARAFTAS